MYGYFENIEKTLIDLSQYKGDFFSYVSKTSLHSDVTTWAYGDYVQRECVDLVKLGNVKGKFTLNSLNKRVFLKVIACLPDWEKYVNSFVVRINGQEVYNNDKAFFEQVNLGWPSLYIQLDTNNLLLGENQVEVFTKNSSGAGFYLSQLAIVTYPDVKDLEQISVRNFIKNGNRFGVAVKDTNEQYVCLKDVKNCVLDRVRHYKDMLILSFIANGLGKANATVVFSDCEVQLLMPEVVENTEDFIFGSDSDDHRHDNSTETQLVFETLILSNMGNFIQFRPQQGRNHFELLSKNQVEDIISLMDDFGMKYGLCDADVVMQYITDINPQIFYGDHIHEPYLFFNPALFGTPYQEHFLCEPEKLKGLKTFGEGRALYMDVLRRSVQKFSKGKGLTSLGSPSLMCVYEGDSGVDRITIEPVSNLNLLVGAVRATSVNLWGAHVPTDWYFGVPVDKVKSNKYRLALQYLYLNGASYLYAENSLFKTNAFERCDWESEFCVDNRKYHREFFDFALTHQRKGELIVENAILYGKNEFFMWKLNDRIAELNAKDWDSNVWGKWDNAYQIAWNASEQWLPVSDKANVFESPLNKNLFSGTPYGNVDVVSVDKDLSKYKTIALLGWNTMDLDLLDKLKDYVYNGGRLMISYAQMNCTDTNDSDFVYPTSDLLKDFIGLDITGITEVQDGLNFEGENLEFVEDMCVACGNTTTAQIICKDKAGNGVVYKNKFGKGEVYFIAFSDYIKKEQDIEVIKRTMALLGESGNFKCDNKNVSFTVRKRDEKYFVSVLNMNCIEGAKEKFNLTVYGKSVCDEIDVGEVKEYIF